VQQTSEACDDGNTANDDGCSSTCAIESCGDGVKQASEGCDDGNTNSNDGCSAACVVESCGDGVQQTSEACDDGNTANDDGCSSTCAIESCGDGVQQANEGCDDGNTSDDDGCTAACVVESCGDGIIQSIEQCEGADLGGNDCLSAGGFVGGTLACNAACAFDTSACIGPGCGNGIVEAGEACDDGNTGDNDGCSALCAVESCGDGITQTSEGCDDGNGVNTDACKNDCTLPACGDTVVSTGEVCDDGNTANGDGCRSDCLGTEQCGDNHLDVGETCDDGNTTSGDGCSATCVLEICGDGAVTGAETCDDGNTTNGDCCSASCQVEAGCEIEANDATATANAFSTTAVNDVVWGHITPANDVDYYRVTVPAGATGVLSAATIDAWDGTLCASNNVDTYITIYDAAGTTLASNDDISFSDYCSSTSATGLAAGDYYVAVSASPFAAITTFAYSVRVTLALAICGNGTIDAGEQCDDGNTTGGDGCSATCGLEVVAEVEPNGTSTIANGPYTPGSAPIQGSIDPATDDDWYSIEIAALTDLRLETFDGTGTGCASIDTVIDFYGTDGTTLLATNDEGGIASCSLLDSVTSSALRALTPGRYYVRVTSWIGAAVIPAYRLAITYNALCGDGMLGGSEECDGVAGCDANCQRIPVCGDALVDAPEQCDDGNTAPGDGCDATCMREQTCGNGFTEGTETCDDGNLVSGDGCDSVCALEAGYAFEAEPNDAILTANGPITGSIVARGGISPVADQDYYMITSAAAFSLRVETFDGTIPRTSCATIDTIVYVYDAAGTQLATNDDGGLNFCSLLDPAVDTGVRNLAAGTYYVRVIDYANDGTIPAYQLDLQMIVCGDNVLGVGEQCDDGNTVDDATCNSNCTLPACGDARVGNTPGETCDDGNTASGDGCDSNCTPTGCGNTILTAGEQCDDGNVVNGDGCDATCILENPCGNNILDATEQCDDGNNANGDGCDSTCVIEPGWAFESGDNGAIATANGPYDRNVTIRGAITPVADADYYMITSLSTFELKLETFDGDPARLTCATGIDTVIYLYDSAGTTIISDDQDGINSCSMITPVTDAAVRNLAAGTYYVRVEDWLNNGTIAAYQLQITFGVCGDGITSLREACDDGNTVDDATCNSDCTLPACGDTRVGNTPGETCDDGNTTSGDGCSATCVAEVCGDGVINNNGAEQCDDGNTTAGDGCSATCQLEEPCGNGVLEPLLGEQCDDGNTLDGDGCTFSTTPRCQLEPGHYFESEPNDDGAVATATNDYSTVNANGPTGTGSAFSGEIIIHGQINQAGDDDTYRITNTTAASIELRIDTWSPVLGIGRRCGTLIDTAIYLYPSTGGTSALTSNLDRNGAFDRCSGLTRTLAAGDTIYLRVIWYGSTASSASASDQPVLPAYGVARYLVTLKFPVCGDGVVQGHALNDVTFGEECDPPNTPTCDATCQRVPVCGDGYIDGTEQCDDQNVADLDGCSATCTRELTIVSEVEPNGDAATAQQLGTIPGRPTFIELNGSYEPPTGGVQDNDWYTFTLADRMRVQFSTYATTNSPTTGTSCPVDSVMYLYNGIPTNLTATAPTTPAYTTGLEATLIEYDDDDNFSTCSLISGTDTIPQRVILEAGTYYLRHRPFSSSSPTTTTNILTGLSFLPLY
ncbi:DVUA0089 family protein, partial [Myxococcota bacterium]|nr:DVUA0089 family protein [Myxococcota bacterium]